MDEDQECASWHDDFLWTAPKGFLEYFRLIEDPRSAHKTAHSLLEIIFIAVCAYTCGANSWDGVYEFAKARENWLRKYLKLTNGLPSRVSYWRVFSHIDPTAFQKCFRDWIDPLIGSTRHIAIDGKTLKGVHQRGDHHTSLVLVSAWATERGLLLGQVKTDAKSNEITAIPRLLDVIHVKDCLISLDAAGCQLEIAKKIIDLGGDYLFSLKGNQGKLKEDVKSLFDDMIGLKWESFDYEYVESLEKGHGRVDSRKVYLVRADGELTKKWLKVHSLILVVSGRQIKQKESVEHRYYISSSPMKVDEMAIAIRRHWSIENGLHWSLDVGFREDRQVAQRANLAENLAVLRRIAFNHLNQSKDGERPLSIENKRLKAAMLTDYLEEILNLGSCKKSI